MVCLSMGLALIFATLTIRALAQSAATPTQLEAALTLLQAGEAGQAQPLFAAIGESSPTYEIARAYEAVCRYEICRASGTNSYQWFLDALTSPVLQQASLPLELREDLAFKQVDALYQSRQFGAPDAIPLIAGFKAEYPGSTRMAALAEYELAAWFERGMQQVYGASLDETKRFPKSWTNGLACLQQFLSRVQDFPTEDYSVLRDRTLAEDLQLALAVSGAETGTPKEVSIRDEVRRQNYGLMRIGLHQKLRPEEWEQNLQMLADCRATLQALPVSRDRARWQRHLAAFAFRTGERLHAEAAGTAPHETETIAAKRAVAGRYFEAARVVQRLVVEQEWTRTGPTDMALLWVASFNSHYCERDYAGLLAATVAQLAHAAPGSPDWLAAKLYHGVALNHQTPPQSGAAAAAFEEVLSYGFQGLQKDAVHDHMVLSAARWRIHLALHAGEPAAALKVVQSFAQDQRESKPKEKFLEDHAWVVAWAGGK